MTAGRKVNSTMFAFSPPIMMASYCSKYNKVVLMASSMHDDKVAEEEPHEPDIILYYNETKGGVDTVDQMVRNYSCYVTTRRWLSFFLSFFLWLSATW